MRARCFLVAVLVVSVLACSGDDGGATRTTTTASTTTAPPMTAAGEAPTPRATLREAVEAVLTAEQAVDHETSYRLLSTEARVEFPDVTDWVNRRTELPPITGFSISDDSQADQVVALVRHEPGLDPFIGLSPAEERQTWTGAQEDGGWLVAAEPDTVFVLPDEAKALETVEEWTGLVRACDEEGARRLEAVDDLFGISEGASMLCDGTGELMFGTVGRIESGPQSADLVAQYSTDVLDWARVVPVTAPDPPFFIVLAPIGDVWQVLGFYD